MKIYKTTLFCIGFIVTATSLYSADWPMWRHDAGRTGSTDEKLPQKLELQWKRELGTPVTAWPPSQEKLQFDKSYEPVVAGKRIFVPSMNKDKVTAFDTDTGKELWRFYADGPVRFAPVVYKEKLFFVSDDGNLYCLNIATGKLIRKLCLAPAQKKLIGNNRMISIWPARGGPVLLNGRIYTAAGIWPFMGTFIYSIDAETGKVVWCNSGSGSIYIQQQHNSPAFAGVAPQGYFAVTKEKLLVSGGRTVPAAYDTKTGKYLYFDLASRQFDKSAGGYGVSAAGNFFHNGRAMYNISNGKGISETAADILTDTHFYSIEKPGELGAREYTMETFLKKGRRGKRVKHKKFKEAWKHKTFPVAKKIMLNTSGSFFCAGANGEILSFSISQKPNDNSTWKADWHKKINGNPWSMLAADKKLFVISDQGTLYCFGAKKSNTGYLLPKQPLSPSKKESAKAIKNILSRITDKNGYCFVYGIGSGDLIKELIKKTNMHVIVIPRGQDDINGFRRKMDDAGFYGNRVAVFAGKIEDLPSYFANLAIIENTIQNEKSVSNEILRILRPYGGKAFFLKSGKELKRNGPLPGSGSWTHQYADAGNSVVSKDKLVKLPLGILWFGGPSNDKILPRHGHGPTPQVINGRVFIEGRNILRATDVYTGRLLWEKEIKDLGKYYDNTSHHPGANAIGSNYVCTKDAVYVITPEHCLVLSPRTGKTIKTFTLPNSRKWGFIATEGDYLVAASTPISILVKKQKKTKKKKKKGKVAVPESSPVSGTSSFLKIKDVTLNADYATGSQNLSVLDRRSGKILWSRKAAYNFRHNSIIMTKRAVYCIDRLTDKNLSILNRRGYKNDSRPTLYSLDIKTGNILWKTDKNVFGTWLGYSIKHNILMQATSNSRDRASDEPKKGLATYNATTGKPLWKKNVSYGGPCMLHKDKIIAQDGAFDLLTGEPAHMKNPFSKNKKIPWAFKRNYGCNTVIASENLLTFRSAAAGYFDMVNFSGTGNLGGFKSGCTSNLIAADGVLNAPDYTRTCTCSYQNQSSLALIHMPEVESWTFSPLKDVSDIEKIGLNFGAPGDCMSDSGTLWLDVPSAGSPSPKLKFNLNPAKPETFTKHSSLIKGKGLKWVAASGITDIKSIQLDFIKNTTCDINLYFSEPEVTETGKRIFSVIIEGQPVIENLDIFGETKAKDTILVKKFKGLKVNGNLEISFKAVKGKPVISGIEIINTQHSKK